LSLAAARLKFSIAHEVTTIEDQFLNKEERNSEEEEMSTMRAAG
jgi:hypothetical protein